MYTVMVVDDDATSLAIMKALLSKHYKVATAKSGVQALGYLRSNPKPAVLFLDMEMPGLNGTDVFKSMLEDSKLCDIPVFFLIDHWDNALETQGIELGGKDFLIKPVNAQLILSKISQQIEVLELYKENKKLKQTLNAIRQLVV